MDEGLVGGFFQIHHFHRILVCIIKDGYPNTTRRSLDYIIFISTPQWGLWGKNKMLHKKYLQGHCVLSSIESHTLCDVKIKGQKEF